MAYIQDNNPSHWLFLDSQSFKRILFHIFLSQSEPTLQNVIIKYGTGSSVNMEKFNL